MLAHAAEKQLHPYAVKQDFHLAIIAFKPSAVPYAFLHPAQLVNTALSGQVTITAGAVLCLPHLYHPEEVAVEMAAFDKMRQLLEPEDAFAKYMRVYAPHLFHAQSGLRHIGIIRHKADWQLAAFRAGTYAKAVDKLSVDNIEYVTPIDAIFLHETIEHVLLTDEETAKGRPAVMEGVLNAEEWEKQQKAEHMQNGKLTVSLLGYSYLFLTYIYGFHKIHDAVYCFVAVILQENFLQFREFLMYLCTWLKMFGDLFVDTTNLLIFRDLRKPLAIFMYLYFAYLFTCES